MSEITNEMLRAALAALDAELAVHPDCPSESRLMTVLSAVAPLIAAAEREACAEIADLYADENMRMCGDSIMNDPLLAKARHGRLRSEGLTVAEAVRSDKCQMDGLIHSSGHAAAEWIASAIRARGTEGAGR